MATKMDDKTIEITIRATVGGAVTEEQIAERVEAAVKNLAGQAKKGSKLSIRTAPREGVGPNAAGGYESRLWEKATC
jgi:hypothetical protein